MVWDDRFKNTARLQLAAARLCLDCEVVYHGDSCPACDSRIFYKLTDAIPAILHPCVQMDEPSLFEPHTNRLGYLSEGSDAQFKGPAPAVKPVPAKVS